MKWLIPLVLVGCGVQPLTSAELFGGAPDAAEAGTRVAPPVTDAASPPSDTPAADTQPAVAECRGTNLNGSVSGDVSDDCDGSLLDALVGVGGKHTCSFSGKGSFHISGLPVGCDHFLTSIKEGYFGYGEPITIKPNGNPGLRIRLRRKGGCPGPRPDPPACSCTAATCTAS